MASSADLQADLKQFRELHTVFMDANNKLKQVAVQGRSRDQERTRCLLTLQELQPLPDSVNAYKGLGRAFIQEAKPEIVRQLTEDVKTCEEELEKLKSTKDYLEKKILESETSIKELLRTNEALARQILHQ